MSKTTPNPLILYIHGFNSSPQSFKARQFDSYLSEKQPQCDFVAPALSDRPDKAIALLSYLLEEAMLSMSIADRPIGLVGSSLGGYYATYLSQKYDLPAVLVNPAVRPYELLKDYLGENENYHTGEKYTLTEAHMDELKALELPFFRHPENLWVLLQQGDEVLDYRQAEALYHASKLTIEPGGDHSFQGFERYFDDIIRFIAGHPID